MSAKRKSRVRQVEVIWDLPDEQDGNWMHIFEGHDLTIEEVEEVLMSYDGKAAESSKSSGRPMIFGETTTGKYIAIVFDHVLDDPLTVYPVTAFIVPRPTRRKK